MCQSQLVLSPSSSESPNEESVAQNQSKSRRVSFSEELILGYSKVPIIHEDDWDNVYSNEATRRESIARAHGYANFLACHDDVDDDDYDLVLCRAYQFCQSRKLIMSMEDAQMLSRVILNHSDRRGLEMMAVPWLRECSISRNAVDLVLHLQHCLLTESNNNDGSHGNFLSEDAILTMALAYRRLSEPSLKFSFLLATIDREAVVGHDDDDDAKTKLVTTFEKLDLISTVTMRKGGS
jgi:hypothetical protein